MAGAGVNIGIIVKLFSKKKKKNLLLTSLYKQIVGANQVFLMRT